MTKAVKTSVTFKAPEPCVPLNYIKLFLTSLIENKDDPEVKDLLKMVHLVMSKILIQDLTWMEKDNK